MLSQQRKQFITQSAALIKKTLDTIKSSVTACPETELLTYLSTSKNKKILQIYFAFLQPRNRRGAYIHYFSNFSVSKAGFF